MSDEIRLKTVFVCPFSLDRNTGTPIRARTVIREMSRRVNSQVISLSDYPGSNIRLPGMWSGGKEGRPLKFRVFRFAIQSFRHLLREKPEVVHCFTAAAILPGVWYRTLYRRARLIFEMHGISELEMKKASRAARTLYRGLDRLGVHRADIVIAMSRTQEEYLVKAMGVSRARIKVLWGPVDLDLFRYLPPQAREEVTVGYTGNDSYWQGVGTILDAARMLQNETGLVFHLVGLPPDKYIHLKLPEVKITGNIPLEEIPGVLAACDVLLSTRIRDMATDTQYPHKLSVYLAAGRPVIATDVDDQRAVIEGAACGQIIPPGDPHSLAQAILAFKDMDREKRIRLGENARRFAEKHFSLSVLGDSLEEIYLL